MRGDRLRAVISYDITGVVETEADDHVLWLGVFDMRRLFDTLTCVEYFLDSSKDEQGDVSNDIEIGVKHNNGATTLLVRPYNAKGKGWFAIAGKKEELVKDKKNDDR